MNAPTFFFVLYQDPKIYLSENISSTLRKLRKVFNKNFQHKNGCLSHFIMAIGVAIQKGNSQIAHVGTKLVPEGRALMGSGDYKKTGWGQRSISLDWCVVSSFPRVSRPLSVLFPLGVTASLRLTSTPPTLVRQPKVFIAANGVGEEVLDHTGLGACGSVSGVGSEGREAREG